ncbi:hypothetical protein Moror_7889 [Moniliophthora roreri MCA 2997]|uniref:Uncharacterized protein n=1 Tax=Moniliophthora roreri (strain MCA 2997) TaxID=1381753 RepID=V2XC12_MONRO|nr:hypothetical protein Moror_7889 [Moniliophthora roreri MCA 2997]
MIAKARAALLTLLGQGLASVAQLTGGAFYFACFPDPLPGPNTPPFQLCPPEPVTPYNQFYWSKCICTEMVDSMSNPFMYCITFDTPASGAPSFENLCSNQQLQVEDTCSDITDINDFSDAACSGTSSVSQFLGALCSNKTPLGRVKNVFGKFGIGRLVVGFLNVACAANPTLENVNTVCDGIGVLSTGCKVATAGSGYISIGLSVLLVAATTMFFSRI